MAQLPAFLLCKLMSVVFSAFIFVTQSTVSQASPTQTVSGTMYAENFTYYKLSGEGWLRLELHSLEGDVDLYVSGLTLQPTFSDFELKSESCGLDTVDIHSVMNRPVGIALYAHPFYMQSAYRLDINVIEEHEFDEYEKLFQIYHYLNYEDEEEQSSEERNKRSDKKSKSKYAMESEDEEEEPVWWTILLTILKFILEVIV